MCFRANTNKPEFGLVDGHRVISLGNAATTFNRFRPPFIKEDHETWGPLCVPAPRDFEHDLIIFYEDELRALACGLLQLGLDGEFHYSMLVTAEIMRSKQDDPDWELTNLIVACFSIRIIESEQPLRYITSSVPRCVKTELRSELGINWFSNLLDSIRCVRSAVVECNINDERSINVSSTLERFKTQEKKQQLLDAVQDICDSSSKLFSIAEAIDVMESDAFHGESNSDELVRSMQCLLDAKIAAHRADWRIYKQEGNAAERDGATTNKAGLVSNEKTFVGELAQPVVEAEMPDGNRSAMSPQKLRIERNDALLDHFNPCSNSHPTYSELESWLEEVGPGNDWALVGASAIGDCLREAWNRKNHSPWPFDGRGKKGK